MHTRSPSELLRLPALFDFFDADAVHPMCTPELLSAGLCPPLPLLTDENGERHVIWGFACIRAAAGSAVSGGVAGVGSAAGGAGIAAEEPELPVRPLSVDTREAFLIALRMEGRIDAYSVAERARMAAFMKRHHIARDPEIDALVLSRGSFLPEAERFLALPEPLQNAVSAGFVDVKTAEKAAELPGDMAGTCIGHAGSFTFANRRKFITLLWEVWKRDELPEDALGALCAELFAQSEPLAALYSRRYPLLSAQEKEFANFCRRTLSGSGVTLLAPPYFEGGSFSVEFRFRSKAELARRIGALQKAGEEVDELFRLL